MEKLYIVANFKSFKTESEANNWLEGFKKINELNISAQNKEVIICPPFTLLSLFKKFFETNNIVAKIGAQNISPFDEGAYTGEINAKQIKEFAEFVLIGHSERRNNFSETDEALFKKTELALKYGLAPIFLVQSSSTKIPENINLVAYEPVFAIGSGTPDTPENANKVSIEIKKETDKKILYGGSVNSANIKSFTLESGIDGALVGGASLEAEEFIKIIQNA